MRFFAQRTLLPLLAAFALLAGACSTPPEEQPAPDTPDASSDRGAGDETTADPATEAFAGPIEAAQGAAAWHTHDAVQAALRVELGGNTVLTGDLTFRTDGTGSRVATADGKVAVWDGETAWVSPADAEMPQARFHVLTWPYFFAVPFKLRDPGTHLEDLGELPFRDTALPAARLTFDGAVGDTPDDWYVLYRDAATSRLAGMGYVVTYGRSLEEAEAEPHAISYGDFVDVDGVQVPTTWQFWHWSREKGVSGEPIGRATLTDVRFVTPATDAFTAPEGAEEATLPDAG